MTRWFGHAGAGSLSQRKGSRSGWTRARWWWLAGSVVCWASCTGSDRPARDPPDASDWDAGAPKCHPVAALPTGDCCPAGQVHDPTAHTCIAVGPPECASSVIEHPEGCHPRWCAADAAGPPCGATDTDCGPTARPCTAQELAAGQGCLAGEFPNSDGSCRPAGWLGGASLRSAPAAPALADLELAFPQPGPLPALDQTWFCGADGGQSPRLCRSLDPDCTKVPTPTGCVRAGVPWVCPPGFVAKGPLSKPSGLPACEPDPADCGTEPWPAVTGASVFYVDPKAAGQGDGTKTTPWSSLQDAVKSVPQGSTLLLAAGDHKTPSLAVTKPLKIVGRCAALARIVGLGPDPAIYAVGKNGALSVHGVSFESPKPGIAAFDGGKVVAERVFVDQVGEIGAVAHGPGSQLSLRQAVVTGTKPVAALAYGAAALAGGALDLVDVRLADNLRAGVHVRDPQSRLTGKHVRIDGTRPVPTGVTDCAGLLVESAGSAAVEGAAVVDNQGYGIAIRNAPAQTELRNVVVMASRAQPAAPAATAGIAVHNAQLVASGLRVSDNQRTSLLIGGPQAKVQLDGAIVDYTTLGAGNMALGAMVAKGAQVTMREVRLSQHRDSAVWTSDGGTRLTLSHALLDGTRALDAASTLVGCALHVRQGSHVAVAWVRASDADDCGVGTDGPDSALSGAHLVIDHQVARLVAGSGRGLAVIAGRAELDDLRVIDSMGLAVSASQGGRLVASAVFAHQTRPVGAFSVGVGVAIYDQARARIAGLHIADAASIGILVDLGGRLQLADAMIHGGRSLGWAAFGTLVQRSGQLRATGIRWLGNERNMVGVTGPSHFAVGGALGIGFPLDGSQKSVGIAAGSGPFVSVGHSRLEGIAGVALSALHEVILQVSDVAIAGVGPDVPVTYKTETGKQPIAVADALIVAGAGSATIARIVATGYQRAGAALMTPPPGTLRQSAFVGGYYGIVVPTQTSVFDFAGNAAWHNTENRNIGGQLALPPAPKVIDLSL